MRFVTGFNKTASMPGMKLPGPMGGAKVLSRPTRITPTLKPLDPVNGLKGLTGARAAASPMSKPMNAFGTKPRAGLVSRTTAARGALR